MIQDVLNLQQIPYPNESKKTTCADIHKPKNTRKITVQSKEGHNDPETAIPEQSKNTQKPVADIPNSKKSPSKL